MRTILVLFTCLISLVAIAQDNPPVEYIVPEEVNKEYRRAEQLLLLKEYEKALKSFQKVLKRNDDFVPALRGVGACYELLNRYEEAALYYEKAIEINPYFSRALYYETANAHYKCGNYYMALELFMEFDTLKTVGYQNFSYNGTAEQLAERKYYEKLDRNIHACHVAMDSIKFWNIPSVLNVGSNINTTGDEYFPFVSNDQNLIFYTSRKGELFDENLYYSTRPQGEWRIGQSVGNQFNTNDNEGMTTLVRDGRKMFFTACQRKEILGTCDIWEADLRDDKIESTNTIIGYVNSGYWDSQASVNCDGTLLYFASNREGGYGGVDLWVSEKMADGRWGEPKNMGDKINTEGDEEAPFITNDGNTLYFSSTGHLGLGEQDIFMVGKDLSGNWDQPVNLGMPVNSSYRELGFFLSADGKTGYFASNRPGGIGGMDIYKFELSEQLFSDPITFVEGFVMDSVLKTPIQTTINFKNRTPIQTDEDGRFFLCIPAQEKLEYEIRAEDYHPYKGVKNIPLWHNRVFFPLNIQLEPLFRLPVFSGELEVNTAPETRSFLKELRHTILFDFDKSDLKAESLEDLNGFLNGVFDGTKIVRKVEIIGYSDDIGADAYNMILSEKRAKSVGVYLKDKGIRVDKIFIEGRGEDKGGKPKWANRRVEIVVGVEDS